LELKKKKHVWRKAFEDGPKSGRDRLLKWSEKWVGEVSVHDNKVRGNKLSNLTKKVICHLIIH
jgi:hypothetical protein